MDQAKGITHCSHLVVNFDLDKNNKVLLIFKFDNDYHDLKELVACDNLNALVINAFKHLIIFS